MSTKPAPAKKQTFTQHIPTKILTINDMSYHPKINDLTFKIPKRIITSQDAKLKSISEPSSSKLTLVSTLSNAWINKDNDSFTWCLTQKDLTLIEVTVSKMDNAVIKMFLEKWIDTFHSNFVYKKNIWPWMKFLLKYHKFAILAMDNQTIENWVKLRNLIIGSTRYLSSFQEVVVKLDAVNQVKGRKNKERSDDTNNGDGPLLVYYESEDDEDDEKKKMAQKGFVEVEDKGIDVSEENDDMEREDASNGSEEDNFDYDGGDDVDDMEDDEKVFKKNKNDDGVKYNDGSDVDMNDEESNED